jgi:hypothetical protein
VAIVNQPRSFQLWSILTATPGDFMLNAGAYGVTVHASAWGTATLQRVLADGAGNVNVIAVANAFGADGYLEIHLPAGQYRMALAGITAFSGAIELLAPGDR